MDLSQASLAELQAEVKRRGGGKKFVGRFEFLTLKREHHPDGFGYRVRNLNTNKEGILDPGCASQAVQRMLDTTEWRKLTIETEPHPQGGTICFVGRDES